MKNYRRTDLACEAEEKLKKASDTEYHISNEGDLSIETFRLRSPSDAALIGKKPGTYITITTPELWKVDNEQLSEYAVTVGKKLREMLCKAVAIDKITSDTSILVIGLGNSLITADAIGPETLERIEVTRHIRKLDPSLFMLLECCQISAVAPGVLGRTGIESADIVRAACGEVRPDAIVVIDALAAGSIERLACTVQISDAGINPGTGIGNIRSELSADTLGVPVIAVGVPTVVDTSAVVFDALCRSGVAENIPKDLKNHLDNAERFYVTPKESDLITEKISILLARSITNALVIK